MNFYHKTLKGGERVTVGSYRARCLAPDGLLDPQPTGKDAKNIAMLPAFKMAKPVPKAPKAPKPAEVAAKIARQDPGVDIDMSSEHLGRFAANPKATALPTAPPAPVDTSFDLDLGSLEDELETGLDLGDLEVTAQP